MHTTCTGLQPHTNLHAGSKDRNSFNVCHPEVFDTYINIQRCVSQTQRNFIMFIIVLGQHVSILIESSSGPSKKIDHYLEMCLTRV